MSVLERIRCSYNACVRRRCNDEGCSITLDNLPNRVILKGELICPNQKMCDCIIFMEENKIGLVELKGKTAHPTDVIEKLSNSSLVALKILGECSNNQNEPQLFHIVLCKKWRVSEYRTINSRKIKIGNQRFDIIQKKCGASFLDLILRFG